MKSADLDESGDVGARSYTAPDHGLITSTLEFGDQPLFGEPKQWMKPKDTSHGVHKGARKIYRGDGHGPAHAIARRCTPCWTGVRADLVG